MLGPDGDHNRTTYGRALARARAGDSEQQNLLGVMLFFGEGVPRNLAEAHRWFHAAADRGHARAQANLAVMHHLGAGVPRDPDEAERYFQLARTGATEAWGTAGPFASHRTIAEAVDAARRPTGRAELPGEGLYMTFCAGCHGLNGIAAYVSAPSFAVGERLDKSDAQLLRSLRHGHGEMPGWDNKLPPRTLTDVLAFVRSLPMQYDLGILQSPRSAPRVYFLFGPMKANPSAYQGFDEDDVERLLRTRRR
jgi:mono/diheme cytochrome c family protein